MELLAQTFKSKQITFIMVTENKVYVNYVNETLVKTLDSQMVIITDVGNYNGEKNYQIMAFVLEHE